MFTTDVLIRKVVQHKKSKRCKCTEPKGCSPGQWRAELQTRQGGNDLHQRAAGLHARQALQQAVAGHPEHRRVVPWVRQAFSSTASMLWPRRRPSAGGARRRDSPLTVMLPAVRGTPTSVTGYRPDSAGRDSAAGRDSNSTPDVSRPWRREPTEWLKPF